VILHTNPQLNVGQDIYPYPVIGLSFHNPKYELCFYIHPGPYLHTGHRGPGPGQQISRGSILKIKKIDIEVWCAGEKRLSTREKFKGDLY
jgi:hypothetical protein